MSQIKIILASFGRYCIYGFLILASVLAIALAVVGTTRFGTGLVGDLVASVISKPNRQITIDNISGLLSGNLRVGTITVADANGTYASVNDLSVAWSPLALLSKRFEASDITLGAVTLNRQPLPAAEETRSSTSSQSGFSLPIALKIDHVALPNIHLGAALLGADQHLSLQGNASADQNTIDANLHLTRTDQPDAALSAKLAYAPAQNRLDLNALLREPKGGMLVTLLQLPDQPALAVRLTGDGPLNNWKGALQASLDGAPRLDVTATHTENTQGQTVSVAGSGAFDSLLPPNLRPLFAGQTQIDIATRLSSTGAITVERGKIETDSLSLTASGTYDAKGNNSLSAALNSKTGTIPLNWPLDDGMLAAQVSNITLSLTGAAQATALDARAEVESLSVPQGKFGKLALQATSQAFDVSNRTGVIDTALTVGQMQWKDANLARALQAPLTVKAPIALAKDQISAQPLTLESPALGGTVEATYATANQAATARFALFAAAKALPEQMAAKLKGTAKLTGNLTYSKQDGLSIPAFALESNLLSAEGEVALVQQQLKATLSGTLTDLAALQPNTSGKAKFDVSATGPLDGLKTETNLTIASAKLAGRNLTDFALQAQANLAQKAPSATLTAKGKLDGKPVDANVDLTSANGTLALPTLKVNVGDNHLNGALTFSKAFIPSGKLDFNFPDLGLLAALGGQTAAGDLKGAVNIQDADGKIVAKIDAKGTRIQSNGVTISAPTVAIDSSDVQALALEGAIKAARIETGTTLVENPALQLTRSGNRTDIDLSGSYDKAPLIGKAVAVQDGSRTTLDLQRLSASPRGIAISLSNPTTIVLDPGMATINPLSLKVGGGSVSLQGKAGDTMDLAAEIKALPASLANSFAAGMDASGTVSGKINVSGKSADPKVVYDLRLEAGTVAQLKSAGLPPVTLNASGTFASHRLSVQSTVTGGGLDVKGGGTLDLRGAKPLDMQFNANLPLALVQGLATKQGLVIEGAALADVRVGGTLSAPALNGSITAKGMRVIDTKRNIALENVTVDIALTGDQARINTVSGKISAGGQVSVTGSVDLKGAGLPADMSVKLDHAVYIDGTLVTSTVDGTLSLKGQLLSGPTLSGKLILDKTSITIPSKLPSSIAQLNIKHRNTPANLKRQLAVLDPNEPPSGASAPIALDLQISAPSQIYVRGRGIDAELSGDVAVKGNVSNPVVTGGFTMRRGRIVILTKRLDFSTGQITFGGGLVPVVNFIASTTSGSTTLTATVAGVATDPDISFSSSPTLPQDEVLAQLIFGQSLSKLSPLQIAQLADAVSQLAGGRSTSLFNSLRGAVGVDDLDVSTDAKGNAQVGVGKYLNDKTYLEFQQGSDGSKAIINLDVGRGFKLKGEAGAGGSSGGGVFYEKEY